MSDKFHMAMKVQKIEFGSRLPGLDLEPMEDQLDEEVVLNFPFQTMQGPLRWIYGYLFEGIDNTIKMKSLDLEV